MLFRTQLETPLLGKLTPLCQLISVKPTGKIPNLSTTGDLGRGKTAYHYYQLLPYLSLQAVVVDLEVTVWVSSSPH